jgi:hypothetical protein
MKQFRSIIVTVHFPGPKARPGKLNQNFEKARFKAEVRSTLSGRE